jgi:ribosomal 30S subunit maturation factor RimM
MKAGSGEILVITDVSGRTHMVPFVKDMVDVEKLGEGVITIHPVEGLLDL